VFIKFITVNAHCRLWLQPHKRRYEVWLDLQPGLYAHIDENVFAMGVLDRFFVEQGVKHRIENPTDQPIQLIELMYGEYDEDDICRLEDDYGRN